jgi:hypothetical protein
MLEYLRAQTATEPYDSMLEHFDGRVDDRKDDVD